MPSLEKRVLVVCAALGGLVLGGCGCDGDDQDDDAGAPDAGADTDAPDAPVPPEDGGGTPCERDEDCADETDCTVDRCVVQTRTCENVPDDGLCLDSEFCNGDEVCSRTQGCVPGPSRACNDNNVCTIDSCNEVLDRCIHGPRDFDGDLHVDQHCDCLEGVDCDCNDNDPRIYEGAPEICEDQVDNDCDGLTDAADSCTSPGFDTCDEPLDVTGGGAFVLHLAGTIRHYSPTCGFGATNDVVVSFTLNESADVVASAESDLALTTMAIESECGINNSEIDCNWGWPATVRARSLQPGTYYLIVQSQSNGEVLLTLEILDPTPPPTNEACGGATDVSDGGHYEGSFVDVTDDYATSCGFSYPDLVYRFELAETSDVDVTAASSEWQYLSMSLQTACGEQDSELRCSYGSPSHMHMYGLEPGIYYVVLEGSDEFDFDLDVEVTEPSDPPAGDRCSSPVDVSAGGQFEGTLVGMQDDAAISCGFFLSDQIFSFEIDEPKDVTVRVEGDGGEWMYAAVQDECSDTVSEAECGFGNPAGIRARGLQEGTHYILVESFSSTDFTIDVTIDDEAPPIAVDGNETCAASYEMTTNGGLFTGDTTGAAEDYLASCGGQARGPDEAFAISLLFSARVSITLTPDGWDGVLHLYEGFCQPEDEVNCNDDWSLGESFMELNLNAGNYYLVVDGQGEDDAGPYTLDVLVIPNG